MQIRSLGYDPEADELDLLIDVDEPVPAESVPIDAGVYIRRDRDSGRVVGAFIRGYSHFVKMVREGRPIPSHRAAAAGFAEELRAIVAWQREVERLSQDLVSHLGDLARQREFLEALMKAA